LQIAHLAMILRLLLLAACWHESLTQVLTPSQVTISYHKPITATATCGEINGQPINEMYCSLAGSTQYTPINQYSYHVEDHNQGAYQEMRREREAFVQGGHGCGFCRADAEDKAHPATNMVDGNNSWWMSPPLSRGMQYNQINITIDLNQEFHVAYVWVQMANSPKPGTWALERSADYGKTWKPWFYFADSDAECMRRFGVESLAPIERDDQVICRSDLSSIHPLENGEILLNLMEHRPSRESFMSSTTLQHFTRATNVRLRLIGTRTLQGHLMDLNDMRDPTVTRRYFYAIKEILMGGRCVCNGHASTCDIVDQLRPTTLVCRCEHNTCGDMCEQCCPGYVAKEWQKTTATNNFTCEPCQCFGRTNECEFDPSVVGESLDIHGNKEGGGRCRNCRYNTEGVNCNQCVRGFFRPETREWSDLQPCEQCRCDPSKHNGACAEITGKCECLDRFTGENCDQCAAGYHSPPECLPCDCKAPGTKGDICTPTNGTCPCNEGYGGDFCERCGDGFTNITAGCKECGCNSVGSVHNKCDLNSGDCVCNAQFGGKKCDECAGGYYNFPDCKYCDCDPSGTENGVCDGKSGQCLCKEGFAGRHCDQCDLNFYGYPNCKPCGCDGAGALSGECDAKTGDCQCSGNYTARVCDKCAAGFYGYPECKECSCLHEGAKGLTCDQFGQCFCKENFHGSRCETCKPNFYNFPLCEACNCDPKGVSRNFRGCDKVAPGELCECNTNVQGRICNECKPTFWDLQSYHTGGCVDCACHLAGTISRLNTCKQASGQCNCKRNVGGRACDKCAPGYFNLESFHPHGCEPCNCDVGGALKGDCDSENGQCKCRPRVTGVRCDEPLQHHYFPTLWHHQYEAEDGHTPDNRGVRFAWDPEIFPNFSSRGFAVFSPIQDTILINMEAPKATVSKILLKVHNPSNVTMTAQVTLSRAAATPGETEQTTKQTFPPSPAPYISEVTLTGKPFVISAGSWVLKVETKQRLFWDFVVILPSEYYEGTNLVVTHNKACEAGVKDGEKCLDLLYPPLPQVARADATKPGIMPFDITTGDGTTIPLEMVPLEQVREDIGPAAFIRADNNSRIVTAKVDVPEDDKYVVLMEYFNLEKTDLSLGMNVTQNETIHSGQCTIHYCPYSAFCRELITENGQPLLLSLEKGKAQISFLVGPNHEFGLHSINLIREKDWNNQYLQQVPVCVRRNKICEPLSFPAAAESVVVEAEHGQRESRPVSGDKLSFDVANEEDVVVVPLDASNPTLEVSGVVQSPYHYMIMVHYFNNDNTPQSIDALVSSRDNHFEAVVPFAYCPSIGGCRALIREKERPESIQFWLEDKYTVQFLGNNLEGLKGPIYIDSITAVPYHHFSSSLMSPLPHDLSGDFLDSCSNAHFQNDPKTNVSDVCKAHIFSLTTEFNQAAFPCDCSSQGSRNFDCEKYGGQCECKDNIMGRRCDQCAPGYYGFPECKKCKCGKNQLCDSRTGQCSCPLHVEGTECDRCVGFAFGYDRLIGCQKCGCDPQGSEGGQAVCDAESGQCLCKEHVGGRQCDSCLAGYFGFPYCHQCRCNREGTTAQICDGTTAQCKCKENVVGRECEQCKAGTFALASTHDKGCIDCFCFGATDRCQSSHLPVSLMAIDHSLVTTTDSSGKVEVDESNHVVYTGGEERPKVVYWEIPVRKEKDYTLTYGLFMTVVLTSSSSDGHSKEADVVLRGGNYTGEFWSEEQPADPSLPFTIRMHITPESLQHPNGLPMRRDEVMMMLHSLSSIRVKASFYYSAPSAQLIDFTLETADESASAEVLRAVTVEKCACPAPYTGLSCQECADGYYRVKSGKYLGSCVPCNCHGHSGTCDKVTGLCKECQHSTEGEHCETCIEGFYGDATSGSPFACSACACPYAPENNFATSCDVSDEGQTRMCFCKPGYAGDRCEKCAPGFFGDPEASGGSCEPCQCNGNNDLRDPQACHELYGSCHLCQNNTAGDHCESCAPWYHGDAVTSKNCSSCECDQCGAHSCSPLTGSCACKTNVVGERCDRCAADHWGFSRCGGCHNCHCGAASSSSQCDGMNGQCPCRPGATGLRCEQCDYGFWNYGENGCTKCDCEADLSLGTVCDVHTGQCHCQEGATGARCDKCLPEYLRIPTMGCRKCDECVFHLKADVDSLDGEIDRLRLSISNISAGTIDGARLAKYSKQMSYINETYGLLNELYSAEPASLLSSIRGGLEDAAVIRVHSDTTRKGSEENVKKTEKLVQGMYTLNIDSKENIKSSAQVVESLRQLSIALEASAGRPKPIPQWIEESKEIVKRLEESSGRLEEMDGGKMSTGVSKARDAMKEVKEKEEKMKKTIEEKRKKERQLKEYVDDAIQLVTKAKTSAQRANDRTARMNVGKTEAMTKSVNEDAEKTKEGLAKIATLTKEVSAYAEQLAELGEDLKTILSSLNETMETFESGKDKRMYMRFKRDSAATVDLNAINDKVIELEGQSSGLKSNFAATKEASKGAVDAASVYDELSEKMKKASDAAEKAKNTVDEEKGRVDELRTDIEESTKKTNDAMSESEKMRGEMKEVEKDLKGVNEKKETVEREIEKQRERMDRITGGGRRVNETMKEKLEEFVKKDAKEETKLEEVRAKVADLESKAAEKVEGGMAGQLGLKQARANLKEINERKEKGPIEWRRHVDALRNATHRVDRLNEQLRKLKENLAMARDAVNKVSLPAHFEVGSSLDVALPAPPSHSAVATDLTVVFRTNRDGIPVYLGQVSPTNQQNDLKDYMAVEVEQGRPVVTFQLGDDPVRVALNTRIDDNEWHRLDVSRVGRSVKSSLLTPDGKVTMETKTSTAPGEHAILNLQKANSKLYLGGIPIESSTNTRTRSFIGDISEVILNGDSIGLWSVNEGGIVSVNGANKRHSDESAFEREVGVSDGFLVFPLAFWNPRKQTKVSLSFLTYAPDGLLFYLGKDKKFLSIELSQGIVKVAMDLGSGVGTLQTEASYNDGEWHSIRLAREEKQIQLIVDNETISYEMKGDGVELAVGDYYYLGGVPLDVNTRSTVEPLRGCIRNVKLKDDVVNIRSAHRSKGVSASCPSVSLTREVSFLSDRSSAIFKNVSLGSIDQRLPFDLAFRFKTRQTNALMCTVKNDDDETVLSVHVADGHAAIANGEGKEKFKLGSIVSDGQWHYVSMRRDGSQIKVTLDDVYFSAMDKIAMEAESPMEKYSLIFGKQNDHHYIGCIRDVTFGATVLEFAKSERREVRLTGCSMMEVAAGEVTVGDAEEETKEVKKAGKSIEDELELPVPSTTLRTSTLAPQKQITEVPLTPADGPVRKEFYPTACALGNRHPAELKGYRFGMTPNSMIGFNEGMPESFNKEGSLSMRIRPDGAFGPLFYAHDESQDHFLSVYLANGFVAVSSNTSTEAKKVLLSKTMVVDGKWHEIKIQRKGIAVQMTVDEEFVEAMDLSSDSIDFVRPFWIGGLPLNNKTLLQNVGQDPKLKQRIEYMGCIDEITINKNKLEDPEYSEGVEQCALTTEPGLYLGPKGGYAIKQHPQPIDTLTTEIMFRSRSTDGLIYSIGKVDYVGLYMIKGEMILTLKTAAGGTCVASYVPPSNTTFCDGHWHHVRVYRKKKLLTMAVDGNSNMKICNVKGIDFMFTDPIVLGKPEKGMVHEDLMKHETFVGCLKMIDESGQGVTKRDISALTKRDLSKYETFENYKTYGDAHNQCPNT
ncbi:epi-1, partial [Pristionchus pacificus]|uniref:Uncharacterized protein n=1 Tax=Pristionchus pacificus TaxID=54126 RepID=A0A8R1YFW3_PRIPA